MCEQITNFVSNPQFLANHRIAFVTSDKTTWNDLKTNRYEYTLIEKEDTITSKTKINSITDSIYLPDQKEFEILSKKNTNELKLITIKKVQIV